MKKVIVITHNNADGTRGTEVIKAGKVDANGKQWGTVLVMTEGAPSFSNGIFNPGRKRVASLRATMESLAILEAKGLKAGADLNVVLKSIDARSPEMDIFVTETLEAQYEGHTPKVNQQSGAVIVNEAGLPIYRNSDLLPITEGKDVFIASKKAEAVAATNGAHAVENAVK